MGMSKWVMELMEKAEQEAHEKALEHYLHRWYSLPEAIELTEGNWQDFIEDKHKQLFEGER